MLLKKSGSLVVVLLLTGSGVLGQAGWSVAHSPGTVCALQGASVVLPCTYTYPSPYQVMKTIWFRVIKNQETNLELLSEYSGHWTYIGNRMNNCSLRITDLKNSYALEYRFRFETNIPGGKLTGNPGVQLLVTDLRAMVNPDTVTEGQSVILTCSTTCTLTGSPAFIWYRDGSPLSFTSQAHQFTASREGRGNYTCAVKGYEHLPSSAVILSVTYGPKDTSLSVSPSGEIVEGRSVNLTCSSDANPPVQNYTWYKKNETGVWQAGSAPNLNFPNFRSWNRGQYYCEAQNRHGAQNSTGLTVSYAAVANYKYDLAYIITGTCALAALLIVIVLAVCRRCRSVKEAKLNTEILQDAACAVYANVPGRTASTVPPGKTVPGTVEAEHSNVQRPHSQDQEEV